MRQRHTESKANAGHMLREIAPALWVGMAIGLVVAAAPSCGTSGSPGTPLPANCGPETCTAGCCSDKGECLPGQSALACGTKGATCAICATGQACSEQACKLPGGSGGGAGGGSAGGNVGGGSGGGAVGCGPETCTGCCSMNGQCITAQNFNSCGKGGAACAPCGMGAACLMGSCQAASCSECRDFNGTCRGGPTDSDYCGTDGGLCLRCNTANGESCMNGHCQGGVTQCTAQNCADGCCSGTTCLRADSGVNPNFQCGIGGAMCQTCSGGAICNNGSCGGTGGGSGAGGGTGGLGGFGGFGGFGAGGTGRPNELLCSAIGLSCGSTECCDVDTVLHIFPTCYANGASCGSGGKCNGTTGSCD